MGNLVIPAVQVVDNRLMVSSLNIAEVFGKRHKHVLEKIEAEKSIFSQPNFRLTSYVDRQGKNRNSYFLDKRFAFFLITGFTGRKAEKFRLAFIDEFIRMEEILNSDKKYLKLEEENKRLNEKVKALESNLRLESEKYTQAQLENAEAKEKRMAKSPRWKLVQYEDIFGNLSIRWEERPLIEIYQYKSDKCLETITGCTINKEFYDKEIARMCEEGDK